MQQSYYLYYTKLQVDFRLTDPRAHVVEFADMSDVKSCLKILGVYLEAC
jgi:hypothetical protein